MKETLLELLKDAERFSIKLVVFILILIIGNIVIKYLIKCIVNGKGYQKLEKSAQTFLHSLLSISLKILLYVTGVAYLGVPTTTFAAILTSCALAIGLSLQGGLTNIAGGLMILIFKPFKVGDYIMQGAFEGKVESLTIFHTYLRTKDNKKIVMPNGPLVNQTITNYTDKKDIRLDMVITVDFDKDINKTKKRIISLVKENEHVDKEENIEIILSSYTKDTLTFIVNAYVNTIDFEKVKGQILESIINIKEKN